MNVEDATSYMLSYIRTPRVGGYSSYGYDVYIPNVIDAYIRDKNTNSSNHQWNSDEARRLSPAFYAAAWDLCRRGIIRPGVRIMGAQATESGSSGDGYSVTPFGKQWLDEGIEDSYVPTEPGRFAELLKPHRDRYGPDFYERAQEAIRCYGAHAYLACCVMCGAAAEAILLAAAIAREGNEEKVLSTYNSSQGRSRVETMLLGQARERLKREIQGFLTLLKYWRDQAGHGAAANITDNEAYTSLALLLRFATYVDDWWGDPLYSDVIVDRYQRFTGKPAILERTGTSPIPMRAADAK